MVQIQQSLGRDQPQPLVEPAETRSLGDLGSRTVDPGAIILIRSVASTGPASAGSPATPSAIPACRPAAGREPGPADRGVASRDVEAGPGRRAAVNVGGRNPSAGSGRQAPPKMQSSPARTSSRGRRGSRRGQPRVVGRSGSSIRSGATKADPARGQAAGGGPAPDWPSGCWCRSCRMGVRFGSSRAGGVNSGRPSSAMRACHWSRTVCRAGSMVGWWRWHTRTRLCRLVGPPSHQGVT